ncbi:hypothetical protein [Chitinibacter sp. S2-10]|uniref:hypothetical protein n=1 Tax=Chitinibacter sp. S2-10 TaxID=3373597 RepID=UPI003977C560
MKHSHTSIIGLLMLCPLILVFTPATGACAEPAMTFIYNTPESARDTRNDYTWRILRTALERTRNRYGDFVLKPSTGVMNEARQIQEMTARSSLINTMVLPVRSKLEPDLIPVRIPVERGLLGYRVLLIRAEEQSLFDKIKTLDELRTIRIGQGATWIDTKILTDQGFRIVSGMTYEGLFNMLKYKRFDAFSRGVAEAAHELKEWQSHIPNLAIEKRILLYYPMPAYFWFPNTVDGRMRAERVKKGLTEMTADGTMKKMFNQEYAPLLKQLNLAGRLLFRIPNSQLGTSEPLADTSLWFTPAELLGQ